MFPSLKLCVQNKPNTENKFHKIYTNNNINFVMILSRLFFYNKKWAIIHTPTNLNGQFR